MKLSLQAIAGERKTVAKKDHLASALSKMGVKSLDELITSPEQRVRESLAALRGDTRSVQPEAPAKRDKTPRKKSKKAAPKITNPVRPSHLSDSYHPEAIKEIMAHQKKKGSRVTEEEITNIDQNWAAKKIASNPVKTSKAGRDDIIDLMGTRPNGGSKRDLASRQLHDTIDNMPEMKVTEHIPRVANEPQYNITPRLYDLKKKKNDEDDEKKRAV